MFKPITKEALYGLFHVRIQ